MRVWEKNASTAVGMSINEEKAVYFFVTPSLGLSSFVHRTVAKVQGGEANNVKDVFDDHRW